MIRLEAFSRDATIVARLFFTSPARGADCMDSRIAKSGSGTCTLVPVLRLK
jgi:hypothetical protein